VVTSKAEEYRAKAREAFIKQQLVDIAIGSNISSCLSSICLGFFSPPEKQIDR
jgi:hypothetical protein